MGNDYKIPMDIDIEQFKVIISRYKKADIFASSPAIYTIPFYDFEYVENDFRHIGLYIQGFQTFYAYLNIPVIIKLCYNFSSIIIFEENGIMLLERVLIDLDYKNWDNVAAVIKEISNLVSEDGKLLLFSSNIPYWLELSLVVSTTKNFGEIIKVAENHNMKMDYSRHIPELLEDFRERKGYNCIEIGIDDNVNMLESKLAELCQFAPLSHLKEKGYHPPKARRKKLFISYCHKDKEIVHKVVEKLRDFGLYVWLDTYEIDYGDNLIERIDEGINECDLALLFLSENTKQAMFAKNKLRIFYSKVIYQHSSKKNWFLVNMDNVDFDSIYMGLGGYKYFNLKNESVESLFKAVYKKLNNHNYDETLA